MNEKKRFTLLEELIIYYINVKNVYLSGISIDKVML